MSFDPMTLALIGATLAPALFGGGGQKDKLKKLPTKTPEQIGGIEQMLRDIAAQQPGYENAIGLLQDLLNPESEIYKNFEAPYLQEYFQKTIPQLGEQFAGFGGMGGGGALTSSGFGQALGAAGANLQTNLAQMKGQMRMDAVKSLLANRLAQQQTAIGFDPFAYAYQPGSASPAQGVASGVAQGAGQYLTSQLFNPQKGAGGGGQTYPTSNPLTSTYDTLFRSGQIPYV